MSDRGASFEELILEAARRNNVELLQEVLDGLQAATEAQKTQVIAQLLNSARDGIGMGALHLAASHGNYEVLDVLLDQEGLEIDEPDKMEKDTPLHKAVRYTNGLDQQDWEVGHQVVDILIDAGCDPRIRNGEKRRPIDLVDAHNKALRMLLQRAEYSMQVGDDLTHGDDANTKSGESESE